MGATRAELLDESEFSALNFKSGDDVLNDARHIIESIKRRYARKEIDVCERYKHGDLEVVARIGFGRNDGQYHLIFRAVPLGWKRELMDLRELEFGLAAADVDRRGGHDFVLVGVTQLTPGLRLNPSEATKFDDVLKRMLASPPAPHVRKKPAAKTAKNKPAK